jgi:hypothetical protein
MPKTLKIEIEADNETELYPLLQHVFREITEGENYTNYEVESNNKLSGEWLEILKGACKGRYKWFKG